MENFTLSKSELLMINNSLLFAERDLKETIKIYSTGDIDEHFLGSEEEPTYREEIEKVKSEVKKVEELQQKIAKAIYDLSTAN